MNIEVTDEMIYAFAGEPEITGTDAHAISVGLRAVLAIVERDYRVAKICPEELAPGLHCGSYEGHPSLHAAKAPNGSRVTWGPRD